MVIILILLIAGIVGVYCYNRRQANTAKDTSAVLGQPERPADVDDDRIDEEVFAVIMAAVAEFEGTDGFQVLSIKPGGSHWRIAGRLDLINSRK